MRHRCGRYRGAGRPEAALLMETLIDIAARRHGIDPVELRLNNLVPASAMPYTAANGEVLDSGDYPHALRQACLRFGYAQERAEQARRRSQGEWVGLGVAMYIEPCGAGCEFSPRHTAWRRAGDCRQWFAGTGPGARHHLRRHCRRPPGLRATAD